MTATATPGTALRPPLSERLTAQHLGLLLLIQVLWGFNWVAAKLAMTDFSPVLLTGLRFLITAAVLMPFLKWVPGRMLLLVSASFLLGALHFSIGFIGLSIAQDIAPLAIAANLSVPFATVLAVLFLGDRIGAWRLTALALAFGGIVFMAFDPRVTEYPLALALTALSALLWAIGTLCLRQVDVKGAYALQAWVAVVAFPPLLAWSFLFEPSPVAAVLNAKASSWAALAYIVCGTTLIGHAGFYLLLQRYPMPLLAPFLLMSPIFAALGGMLWFGDVVTWRMIVGGLITFAGVLIIVWREHHLKAQSKPAAKA